MRASFDHDALVGRLTASFGRAEPAGVDAYDHHDHETCREQAARLFTVGADPVAWDRLVEAGIRIVGEYSKDVRIAAYLAAGLWHVHGLPGLNAGLLVVAALLGLGDHGFPADQAGRASGLVWLDEALEQALAAVDADALAPADLAASIEAARAVEVAANTTLGKHAPPLSRMSRALQRLAQSMRRADVAEPSTPANGAPPSAPSAAVSSPPSAPEGSAEDRASASLEHLVAAASALRADRPGDAGVFRLLRLGLWGGIDEVPAAVGGRCEVLPIPRAERTRLARLESQAAWLELVDACESLLVRHRFCLDLQRLCLRGLEGLGTGHAAARRAVAAAFVELVTRLPELPRLHARDGSPLADEATRALIAELTRPLVAVPVEPSADDEEIAVVERLADAHVHAGESDRGLQVLAGALHARTDARGRFLLRAALARLLAGNGQAATGAEIHAALLREAEVRRLAEWEPALVRRCAAELLREARGVTAGQRERLPVRAAHAALCELDPLLAAEFTEGVP